MASISSCIVDALNRGAITHDEASELSQRYEELENIAAENPSSKSARSMLSDELFERRQRQKQLDYLTVQAQDKIASDIRNRALARSNMPNAQGPNLQGSLVHFFEDFGTAGYQSVRGIFNALLQRSHSEMSDLLWTFRRSALTMKRFNRPMIDDVARAGFGEKVSAEAKALYGSFITVAEKLRGLFNQAGGNVKWRSDWGVPQSHDPAAVLHAGGNKNSPALAMRSWTNFIEPLLDWTRMTGPISGVPLSAAAHRGYLEDIWRGIVSNGWDRRDPAMTAGAKAVANMRADPRFLVFKDADSWLNYNKNFGSGDVYATMMSHIRGMSMDIAMMQRLGPNPRATVEWMKQLATAEGAKAKLGEPTLLDARPSTADIVVGKLQRSLDGIYGILRGDHVPESAFGNDMVMARNVAYSSKLGSSVVNHTFGNSVIQMAVRHMYGVPWAKTIPSIIKAFGTREDMLRAAVTAEDTLHTMEMGAREVAAGTKLREFSNWMPMWTTHYSGLDAMVNANRRSFAGDMMGLWSSNADKDFTQLVPRLQRTLQGFGIAPKEWNAMRIADKYEPASGAPFLRWREIEQAGVDKADTVARTLGIDPSEAPKAMENLALKYISMVSMAGEAAVPSSSWRVRGAVMGGVIPGTLKEEALRSAAMFKAGFMGTLMISQSDLMSRELAVNRASTAAYITSAMLGLWMSGMIVLQVKNAAVGKDLLSMDPTTPEGRSTWWHALLTSGGLGIFGDFISSEQSSYGHDFLATALGPVATGAEDVLHAAVQGGGAAFHGAMQAIGVEQGKPAKESLDEEAESAVVKMLRNNTPVLSTHLALRAAYNRLLLDQLQYLTDPNAHTAVRKTEQRVRKETGQGYWWHPGEAAPERLPQVAPYAR